MTYEDQELPWKVEESRVPPLWTQPQVCQRPILDKNVDTPRQSERGQREQDRYRRVLQCPHKAEPPPGSRFQVLFLDLSKYLVLQVVIHTYPLSIVNLIVPDPKGFTVSSAVPDLPIQQFRSCALGPARSGSHRVVPLPSEYPLSSL